jgi:hypothetical protein
MSCNNNSQPVVEKVDWALAFDSIKAKNQSEGIKVEFLQQFIDSLNNFREGSMLPHFLLNYNFDSQHLAYWESVHQATSLRKLIFDEVINKEVLREILQREVYKTKPATANGNDYEISIPFSEYSIYELAKYRLEELKNELN